MGPGTNVCEDNDNQLAQELEKAKGVSENDPCWRAAVEAINSMKKKNPRLNLDTDHDSVHAYIALHNMKKRSGAGRVSAKQLVNIKKTIEERTEVKLSYVCLSKADNPEVMTHPKLKMYLVDQDKFTVFPRCYSSHTYWCFDRAVMHTGAMPIGSFEVSFKASENQERECPIADQDSGPYGLHDCLKSAGLSMLPAPAECPENNSDPHKHGRALLDNYPSDPDYEIGAVFRIAEKINKYIKDNVWESKDPLDNECVSFWLSKFNSFVSTKTHVDGLHKDAFGLMRLVTSNLLDHDTIEDVDSVAGQIIAIHNHSRGLGPTDGASVVPATGLAAAEFIQFDHRADQEFKPSVTLSLGQEDTFFHSKLYEAGMRKRTRLLLQQVAEQHTMENCARLAAVTNLKAQRLDDYGRMSRDFGVFMLGSSSEDEKLKFLLENIGFGKFQLLENWFGPAHPFAIYAVLSKGPEMSLSQHDLDGYVTASEQLSAYNDDIIEAIPNQVQSRHTTLCKKLPRRQGYPWFRTFQRIKNKEYNRIMND